MLSFSPPRCICLTICPIKVNCVSVGLFVIQIFDHGFFIVNLFVAHISFTINLIFYMVLCLLLLFSNTRSLEVDLITGVKLRTVLVCPFCFNFDDNG